MSIKAKLQTLIQAFISILILMTLFVASAYATPCHNLEQDTQFNHKNIKAYGVSNSNATIEESVFNYNSRQCCMEICNVVCNMHSIPNNLLLVSYSFENKRLIDISKTKYYLGNELEDLREKIKLKNYYRSSYTSPPSILNTTHKYRVLHI